MRKLTAKFTVCLFVLALFSYSSTSNDSTDEGYERINKHYQENAQPANHIDSNEIESIKKMLYIQQEYWNNGDIYGFMEGYWNSEELIFTSAEHMPEYGWNNTLERYKNNYPTKESMGEFRFEIYDIKLTSNKTSVVNGKWELIRINDHPQGNFWLDLEKFENNWLIVKDSTTSF